MSKIDELLVFLSDGTWHDLSEITHTLKIDYQKLEKIVELLREFNFIQNRGHKICINFDTKKLLESLTEDLEEK